jgi:hypothetical protein
MVCSAEEKTELLKLFEQLVERYDLHVFGISPENLKGLLPVVTLGRFSDYEAAVNGIGLEVRDA